MFYKNRPHILVELIGEKAAQSLVWQNLYWPVIFQIVAAGAFAIAFAVYVQSSEHAIATLRNVLSPELFERFFRGYRQVVSFIVGSDNEVWQLYWYLILLACFSCALIVFLVRLPLTLSAPIQLLPHGHVYHGHFRLVLAMCGGLIFVGILMALFYFLMCAGFEKFSPGRSRWPLEIFLLLNLCFIAFFVATLLQLVSVVRLAIAVVRKGA